MLVTKEVSLENFKAWSGAISTLERIKEENKCEDLEYLLEDLYPNGIDETQLNDILWFEEEWLFECLGIEE